MRMIILEIKLLELEAILVANGILSIVWVKFSFLISISSIILDQFKFTLILDSLGNSW